MSVADMFTAGQAMIAAAIEDNFARTVTYQTATQSIPVSATPMGGELLRLSDDYGGVRIQRTERSYLIIAAALTTAGVQPEAGHKIIDAGDPDGISRTWELRQPSESDPAWTWVGSARMIIKARVQQVAS